MENKRVLGFAIYGCGNISRVHAQSVKAIEGARLVGCADISYERAEAFARNHDICAYADYEALLSAKEIDVVCICTPSGTHAALAIEALAHNKNVVLEKPMALTVAECDEIIAACEKSEGKLLVISQLRAMPEIQRAKQIIESGALGTLTACGVKMKYYRAPEYYKGSWRGTKAMDGGGALMNQGIHGVDLICYLLGRVKNIQSFVRTMVHDIEVEDTAVAICEFECGALGVIEATTSVYPGFNRRIEICGSEGSILIKEGQIERLVLKKDNVDIETVIAENDDARDPTKNDITGHRNQIDGFVRAILGEKDVEWCDEYQGRIAVDVIEKIYKKSVNS